MTHTISIAPDVVRARINALVSLHIFMEDIDRQPLSADNNAALNQTIVFAFSRALVKLARWVENFKIEPINFHDNPDDLLMLEVTFKVGDNIEIQWPLVRRALEEYISVEVLYEILPDSPLAAVYRTRSTDTLASLEETLAPPFDATTTLRLRRTI